MSGGVFWGVCELMILGSLSGNGWFCVTVLLVVWHSPMELAGRWVQLGLFEYTKVPLYCFSLDFFRFSRQTCFLSPFIQAFIIQVAVI